MAQSIRNRLNGQKAEFLRDIKWFGKYETLDMWRDRLGDYKGYGLEDFLEEETGNRNFGLNPEVNLYGGTDAFDKFVSALKRLMAKYEALDADNKFLREKNEKLERLLKLKALQDNQRIMPVLEMINSSL